MREAGAGPAACGFDCAHTWSTYGVGCGTFLQRKHPGFGAFSALCDATVAQMTVLDYDGNLEEGEHTEQTFDVEQGLVYSIASRPGAGLLRTALAIEAPHSNQLLADRVDESKHGAGAHHRRNNVDGAMAAGERTATAAGVRLRWQCEQCEAPYDAGAIELELIELVQVTCFSR